MFNVWHTKIDRKFGESKSAIHYRLRQIYRTMASTMMTPIRLTARIWFLAQGVLGGSVRVSLPTRLPRRNNCRTCSGQAASPAYFPARSSAPPLPQRLTNHLNMIPAGEFLTIERNSSTCIRYWNGKTGRDIRRVRQFLRTLISRTFRHSFLSW